MNDDLYTCAEVQEKLKISRSTMYRLICNEKLPAIRVGNSYRIRSLDLNAFLTGTKKEGGSSRDY